jgi:hypothetical protein
LSPKHPITVSLPLKLIDFRAQRSKKSGKISAGICGTTIRVLQAGGGFAQRRAKLQSIVSAYQRGLSLAGTGASNAYQQIGNRFSLAGFIE